MRRVPIAAVVRVAALGTVCLAVWLLLADEAARKALQLVWSRLEIGNFRTVLPLGVGLASIGAALLRPWRRPLLLALLVLIFPTVVATNLMGLREDDWRALYPIARRSDRTLTALAGDDLSPQVQLKYTYLSLRPFLGGKSVVMARGVLNPFYLRAISDASDVGRSLYEDELEPAEFEDVAKRASAVLPLRAERSLYVVESAENEYRAFRFGDEVILR